MLNEIKLHIQGALQSLIVLALGGTLLQTFLIESGFSEENVTVLLSVLQIIQIVTIFGFSSIADRLRGYKNIMAFAIFAALPLTVYFIILSFSPGNAGGTFWFLALGAIFNIYLGINNILSYKLPYAVMDMSRYGIYNSVSGVVIGSLGFGVSVLLSFLQSKFDFFAIMRVVYILTLAFVILMSAVTFSLKESKIQLEYAQEKKKSNVLKYKPFVVLIIPNVLRGFCTGIIGMVATIGYFIGRVDSTSAAIIMTVTSVASILASLAYSFLTRKIREKHILLASSTLTCLFMALMVLFQGTTEYIVFYTLAYFFMYFVSISVPVSISRTIHYDIIGQYTGGRMLLHTLGTSIAGFVCIPMIKLLGTELAIIISGATQLISGICYYFFLDNHEKMHNMRI